MPKATSVGHPVAVIGAGPVGLAAAARLVEQGLTPLVLEKGPAVASSLRAWGHVRVFTPWELNIDAAARALLRRTGWIEPDPRALPTGADLVRAYLQPLEAHPAIAPHLVLEARVTAITRAGFDKMRSAGREERPFEIRWQDRAGRERRALAAAVIDASGTWDQPNPMGADGLCVPGETGAGDVVAYGIPDILGADRMRYRDRHVLVVGSGHSAIHAVLDLIALGHAHPATRVTWAIRTDTVDKLLGGGLNDRLPKRGALGIAATEAISAGHLDLLAGFAAQAVEREGGGVIVRGLRGGEAIDLAVDRIVVATGFRPGLDMVRELRVELDPAVEAPPALSPLIDPNLHSCGTVRPHGVVELAHPETGFYIAGSKSYGRAPTFLMATGYEQVRSIVAEIAGDAVAAREVRLVLPETGVCSAGPVVRPLQAGTAAPECCGGAAPAGIDACCRADAEAKEAGGEGCGCGSSGRTGPEPAPASCGNVPA
ncbi:FAD-dependent oxidoreductase [Amorphus sp. MBR-141]